ncbi:MAG TPA: SDR family oxidoreductase [Deltaproteobacteria bacterium]|nr:SDR family oxidoreductase [Deltaproteobacteria bacterium]HPJ93434.1 SDR family oxidoreductase [Deltaproteobacteria bacterium]HPR51737.1 SDR family oxidoreductase [Deltaproteobacteria bacterium]
MEYDDKIVWITGASSGIGEALAHTYSTEGAQLILSARNEARLNEVRNLCTNPEKHLVLPLDLADGNALPDKCSEVLKRFGRVDILINNSGVSQRSLVAQTGLEVDRRIMETNFFGTITLTKAVLPSMLERKAGHIVVISSVAGKLGTPLRSSYSASKHALHGFFDSLRAETWKQGIHVTIVCPGFIRTNISINALTADGTPQGTMDEAQACGMSPKDCAEKIVRAVEKNRAEVYIGGKEILGIYLKRFVPGLFDLIIKRAKVT